MNPRTRYYLASSLVVLGLCTATSTWGQTPPDAKRVEYDLRQRAATSGCESALPDIEQARTAHPESAVLARLSGECQIELLEYAEAAEALKAAARLAPEAENTQLYLAVTLYHLEDYAAAWQALEAAKGHCTPSALPQFELYRGLLLLERGEHADAAAALERATQASPGEVEPVASYYAGLSFLGTRDRDEARDAFQRVVDHDGNGPWGKQAQSVLDSVTLEERNWVGVRAGLEYDSNAILLGDGIPLAGDISGESDGRGVWFLEGGLELFDSANWSGGLIVNYAGSAYFELTQFDVDHPTVGGWIDHWLDDRSLLRFRYSFGHAWVGYDSFVFSQGAVLAGYHAWESLGNSEMTLSWERNDYKYDIPFVPSANPATGNCPLAYATCAPLGFDSEAARNRDGNGFHLTLLHEFPIDSTKIRGLSELTLRAGFAYRRYWSKGSDWDYAGYRLSAGFDVELPWKFEFDAEGSWEYVAFEHPSSYPDPPLIEDGTPYALPTQDRLDKVGRFTAILARPITRRIEVSARYDYIRNDSNTAVFNYDRQVVGFYLSLNL